MIRTREERQADRAWCEQFMEQSPLDDHDTADGIILGIALGALIWLLIAGWMGWL